jgi:hypothetical protein
MPNRVFWAGETLAIDTDVNRLGNPQAANANNVRGIQSVGITTTFNLEQVFQLGQLSVYEDVEDIPDIEISIERVLNDDKSLYILSGATSASTLTQNQNVQCDLYFSVYPDTQDNADDVAPVAQAHCSGMYVSSMSWTFPTDGNCTESFTFVGNGKKWNSTGGSPTTFDSGAPAGLPTSVEEAKIWRRQQIAFTTMPASVNVMDGTTGLAKVTNASVSIDLGREAINVLGKKLPYYRYVTYPVEVTCELEVLVRDASLATDRKADGTNALVDPGGGTGSNVTDEAIKFTGTKRSATSNNAVTKEWDLGSKNKLTGVTWGGGTTGGENASITFSYRNFNEFKYTET